MEMEFILPQIKNFPSQCGHYGSITPCHAGPCQSLRKKLNLICSTAKSSNRVAYQRNQVLGTSDCCRDGTMSTTHPQLFYLCRQHIWYVSISNMLCLYIRLLGFVIHLCIQKYKNNVAGLSFVHFALFSSLLVRTTLPFLYQ